MNLQENLGKNNFSKANRKRVVSLILALFLLAVGFLVGSLNEEFDEVTTETATPDIQGTADEGVLVTRVIDGDTIEIETGELVRYIGIDTPETRHPQRGLECFGREATEINKELVEGKQIILEKDVSETDRYGRLLRYVHGVDPSTGSGQPRLFVNEIMVRLGYATAVSFPPDIKYQELFREAEREAREAGRGLWGSCPR